MQYKSEKKVYEALKEKGVECYLPLKISKRLWSDRIKTVTEPFFACYIFVKINVKQYYDVLIVKGVLKYVCFDNRLVEITEKQMNLLKFFVDQANDQIELTNERLKKGHIVRVINGPFKNTIGEVLQHDTKKYIILRFFELGYTLKVDLGLNEIEILPNDFSEKSTA